MLMKVSDLDGRALNYAVAVCLWGKSRPAGNWHCFDTGSPDEPQVIVREKPKAIQDDEYNPSGNWAHGGPLIEQYGIELEFRQCPKTAIGKPFRPNAESFAHRRFHTTADKSVLIPVCQALMYQEHGDEIEIPDELCEVAPCK